MKPRDWLTKSFGNTPLKVWTLVGRRRFMYILKDGFLRGECLASISTPSLHSFNFSILSLPTWPLRNEIWHRVWESHGETSTSNSPELLCGKVWHARVMPGEDHYHPFNARACSYRDPRMPSVAGWQRLAIIYICIRARKERACFSHVFAMCSTLRWTQDERELGRFTCLWILTVLGWFVHSNSSREITVRVTQSPLPNSDSIVENNLYHNEKNVRIFKSRLLLGQRSTTSATRAISSPTPSKCIQEANVTRIWKQHRITTRWI